MSKAREMIPADFYTEAWAESESPMLCADATNRVVQANYSFAQMLGYSAKELEGKLLIEIVPSEHTGGYVLTTNELLTGRLTKFRIEQQFYHKLGRTVDAIVVVRRYPEDRTESLLYFHVEASTPMYTAYEMQQTLATLHEKIERLEHTVADRPEDRRDSSRDNNRDNNISVNIGDSTAGNKIGGDSNSDKSLKIIAGALVAVVVVVAWLFYYVATLPKPGPIEPPPSVKQLQPE